MKRRNYVLDVHMHVAHEMPAKPLIIKSPLLDEFNQEHSSASVVNSNIVSSVACLIPPCPPCAIGLFIIAIIVKPVKALAFGAAPHVIEKYLKGITPSLADHDAPASISRISLIVRILTALHHTVPCLIFTSNSTAGFLAMGRDVRPQFFARTSASPSSAASQMRCFDCYDLAAFAAASPLRFLISGLRGTMKNSQPSENLSGEVYNLHGWSASIAAQPRRRMFAHPSPFAFYAEALPA